MTLTRLKVKCESVTYTQSGAEIKLLPVTCGSEENSNFFKYTPYGEIRLGIINDNVIPHFIPGDEFYIDVTPA